MRHMNFQVVNLNCLDAISSASGGIFPHTRHHILLVGLTTPIRGPVSKQIVFHLRHFGHGRRRDRHAKLRGRRHTNSIWWQIHLIEILYGHCSVRNIEYQWRTLLLNILWSEQQPQSWKFGVPKIVISCSQFIFLQEKQSHEVTINKLAENKHYNHLPSKWVSILAPVPWPRWC